MANASSYGAYVPTTNIWDVQQLYQLDVNSPAFKELLVRLYQNVNNIALVLNLKDSAIYDLQEFVNGQTFFPNPALTSASATTPTYRPVYRKVINFGALPAATKSVNHNITCTATTTFTRIYGAASNTTGLAYLPLPYANPTAANNISIDVSSTQVTVTTGIDRTAYNVCYIVLEYMQT